MFNPRWRHVEPFHQLFRRLPQLGLLLSLGKIEIGHKVTEPLLIHLVTVIVIPLNDFLLIPAVVAFGHGKWRVQG